MTTGWLGAASRCGRYLRCRGCRGLPGRGCLLGVDRVAGGGEVHRGRVGLRVLSIFRGDPVRMTFLPAGIALGELFVQLPRVEEDERRKLDRAGRGVDGAGEPGLDEQRKQPAMVQVSVGQEHRIEGGWVIRERDPVADGFVRAALEHAAVDQDARPVRLEQELGTGDGGRATEKVDLHGSPW